MQYNLLKMVQLILSAMDGDEVNSIGDTTESLQVVDQIESCFYDLMGTIDFQANYDFFELLPSNDVTRPTLAYLPKNVGKLESLKYDLSDNYSTKREIRSLIPISREQFFDRTNSLDTNDANVYNYELQIGTATIDVRGYSDREPTYYTTFDDQTILFDNFDSDVSATIVGNRTMAYGMVLPVFLREDTFVPDLSPRHFTLLFNEAKSACFADLKQITNSRSEQKARRGWVQAHRKDPQIETVDNYRATVPNFGRGRNGRRYR